MTQKEGQVDLEVPDLNDIWWASLVNEEKINIYALVGLDYGRLE